MTGHRLTARLRKALPSRRLATVWAIFVSINTEALGKRDKCAEATQQSAVRHHASVSAGRAGDDLVGSGLPEELQERLRGCFRSECLGGGEFRAQGAGQKLRVDTTQSRRDDRPELTSCPYTNEEFAAQTDIFVRNVLHDEYALDVCGIAMPFD